MEEPIISGTSEGSGKCFSQIGIGDPSDMILDTGSDITGVQCAPCHRCNHHIFDPSSSFSYAPLSCETPQCKSLDQSQCRSNGNYLYQVPYGDGSYIVGDFVTETVTIGSSSVESIAIGCSHNNQGLFVGAAGLLGLSGGSLSFPAQLDTTSTLVLLARRFLLTPSLRRCGVQKLGFHRGLIIGAGEEWNLTGAFGELGFSEELGGENFRRVIEHFGKILLQIGFKCKEKTF